MAIDWLVGYLITGLWTTALILHFAIFQGQALPQETPCREGTDEEDVSLLLKQIS